LLGQPSGRITAGLASFARRIGYAEPKGLMWPLEKRYTVVVVANNLKRSADRVTNICERVAFVGTD
jgi:hypothetical protein